MFSLILVLAGLALVAAIAVTTVYYGGDTATAGSANAEAASLLAQSEQIASASAAYTTDHNGIRPPSLEELVAQEYLNAIPPGWQEPALANTPITSKVVASASACELFNRRQGLEGIPHCDDFTTLNSPVCCQ
jgi:hypothetical protein